MPTVHVSKFTTENLKPRARSKSSGVTILTSQSYQNGHLNPPQGGLQVDYFTVCLAAFLILVKATQPLVPWARTTCSELPRLSGLSRIASIASPCL